MIGRVMLARSQPEAALKEIEQEKDATWRRYGLALAYHALGRRKEADAALAEFARRTTTTGQYQIAEVYALRGEGERSALQNLPRLLDSLVELGPK